MRQLYRVDIFGVKLFPLYYNKHNGMANFDVTEIFHRLYTHIFFDICIT
jgi:hypothetical protein